LSLVATSTTLAPPMVMAVRGVGLGASSSALAFDDAMQMRPHTSKLTDSEQAVERRKPDADSSNKRTAPLLFKTCCQ
jgi:hypothetical protein